MNPARVRKAAFAVNLAAVGVGWVLLALHANGLYPSPGWMLVLIWSIATLALVNLVVLVVMGPLIRWWYGNTATVLQAQEAECDKLHLAVRDALHLMNRDDVNSSVFIPSNPRWAPMLAVHMATRHWGTTSLINPILADDVPALQMLIATRLVAHDSKDRERHAVLAAKRRPRRDNTQ